MKEDCAYLKVCKGICPSSFDAIDNSCILSKKTPKEYWKEIQDAMIAKGRLERIRHYLSQKPQHPRLDIIEKWATPSLGQK